jgi:transcriptional regulator with PAS, ATPase and Fis domain
VRVIAATNRDLEEAKRTGALREDLYYRLNVFHLHLAPLRERGDDKLMLAQRFVVYFSHRESKPVVGLDDATRYLIMRYSWPGNVRELRNAMERAVIVRDGRADRAREPARPPCAGARRGTTRSVLAGMTVDEVERRPDLPDAREDRGQQDARREDARRLAQDAAQQAQALPRDRPSPEPGRSRGAGDRDPERRGACMTPDAPPRRLSMPP